MTGQIAPGSRAGRQKFVWFPREAGWAASCAMLGLALSGAGESALAAGNVGEFRGNGLAYFASSSADHMKMGVGLTALLMPGAAWSPLLVADLSFNAQSVVNPGAAATATEPLLAETADSGQVLLVQALVQTPLKFGQLRTVTGLSWYYMDLEFPVTGSIPNAPTFGVYWVKPVKRLNVEMLLTMAFNPIGSQTLLINPDVGISMKFFGELTGRLGRKFPFFRAFDGGAAGIRPIAFFGLGYSI